MYVLVGAILFYLGIVVNIFQISRRQDSNYRTNTTYESYIIFKDHSVAFEGNHYSSPGRMHQEMRRIRSKNRPHELSLRKAIPVSRIRYVRVSIIPAGEHFSGSMCVFVWYSWYLVYGSTHKKIKSDQRSVLALSLRLPYVLLYPWYSSL